MEWTAIVWSRSGYPVPNEAVTRWGDLWPVSDSDSVGDSVSDSVGDSVSDVTVSVTVSAVAITGQRRAVRGTDHRMNLLMSTLSSAARVCRQPCQRKDRARLAGCRSGGHSPCAQGERGCMLAHAVSDWCVSTHSSVGFRKMRGQGNYDGLQRKGGGCASWQL